MTNELNYCPNCGAEGKTDYCANCGENLKQYSRTKESISTAQNKNTQPSSSKADNDTSSTASGVQAQRTHRSIPERDDKTGTTRSVPSKSDSDTRIADKSQQLGQFVGLASSALIVAGAFFPWLSASVLGVDLGSVSGTELATGVGVMIAGLIMIALFVSDLFISETGIFEFHIISGALSLIVAGLSLVFIIDPSIVEQGTLFVSEQSLQDQITRSVLEIQIGPYATLSGSLGALAGALISMIKSQTQ